MKIMINSRELIKTMVEKRLSQRDAAEELNIKASRLSVLMKSDHAVFPTTAAKFRRVFGDQVIYIKE